MNCLTFAIRYKLKHPKSEFCFKFYTRETFDGVTKRKNWVILLIKYIKHIGIPKLFMILFVPHFYIKHDGNIYETGSSLKNNDEKCMLIINRPPHLEKLNKNSQNENN